MSAQAQQILSETLKSYKSRNLYTEQQVAGMVELLKKGELSIKSQLIKYTEISDLTPGQKVFQSRLKMLESDLARTISQVKKEQTLLITTATKASFQSGVTNGISELKNAKFPRWDVLSSETQEQLAKQVFSLIDRNALDFMVRFNIQLVGNVHKELLSGIKQGISLGIIRGDSIAEISKGLGSIITDPQTFRRAGKTVFKTAQQRLELITRTETLRAHNQGRLKFFDTINIRRVKWMAVGDERTCPICGGLDGKEYNIDDLPPIPAHPACRCTTVAARARVCKETLKAYSDLSAESIRAIPLTAVAEKDMDCILVPEQIEELAKSAKQEKSQLNKIIQDGKYNLLNGKTLQKLSQQRGIAVTRSKLDMIKLLDPLEPGLDMSSMKTKSVKALMKKHHISVLRSKDDLVKLLKEWDKAHQFQIPDYSKWSIIKLRDEAKANGISVMRTKDDLVGMLDTIEPGVSHSHLKGNALLQKLKEHNIGKVRTKEELIGLLTGKIKQGQVLSKADDLIKQQLAEQIKKAKKELDQIIKALKPHELIADSTQLDHFMKSYVKGYEILAKNNKNLLPGDMGSYIAKLDSAFNTWDDHINSLNSCQLKKIVKQAGLEKWQWMNKGEMIIMLAAKDKASKEAAMEAVLVKWEKWSLKHGGKGIKSKPKSVKVEIPHVDVSKPIDWKKTDSDWDNFKRRESFKFQGKADIDGAHTKYFFTDNQGDRWLFKPVSETFRAYGDEAAYHIGRLIDDQAVDVRFIELHVPGRGKMKGSLQKWKTGLREDFDFRNTNVTNLTQAELEQLQREHVIDWLISNHDSHGKQFIRESHGQVYGIDKGQLYKFMGKDKLSIDYWPNKRWGEKEPIYNTIFRAVQNNELDVDLNASLRYIKQVEKITDDMFLSILKPYAEGRFGKSGANLKAFYSQALHRKNHIREDFEKFYSDILSKRNGKKTVFKFEDVKTGAVKLSPEAEEIVEDAVKAGWQGKTLPLDGDDIEDLNGLVYVEKIKGTKQTQVNLRMKVRPDSEKKLLSQLDNSAGSLPEIRGQALNQDSFYQDILSGVKTLNHHVSAGDYAYNQNTLKIVRRYQRELRNLKKSTDPEVSQMAGHYLKAVNKILKGAKENKKYDGLFKQYLRKNDIPEPKRTDTLPFKKQRIVYEHKQNKNGEIIIEKSRTDDLKKVLRRDHATEGLEYRIDLGDGVEAVYKPWNDSNYYAHRGELELKITGHPNSSTIETLMDKLNDLGLDGRQAAQEDQELVYLYKQAYLLKEDAKPSYKKLLGKMGGQNATKEQRINALRSYWSDKLGVEDITKLSDYNPYGEYSLSGNAARKKVFSETGGYRNTYRFDISRRKLDSELKGYGLYHKLTNGRDVIKTIDTVLSTNGAMVSTVEKIRLGIPVGGMSPLDDMGTGGASYFFTRVRKLPGTREPGEVGMYFKKNLIRRLDAITYDTDKYGRVTGNTVRNNRHSDLGSYKTIAGRYRNDETIFKNNVTLLDNIDRINVYSRDDKTRLLDVFLKYGIKKLPDGRPVKDIILVMGKK